MASKTFDAVDPQGSHNYDNLVAEHGLLAPRDMRPEIVVNMSQKMSGTWVPCGGGEDLTNPRINLSTIHRMKGGEDDNVLLLTT